jgi:hypothetical protein
MDPFTWSYSFHWWEVGVGMRVYFSESVGVTYNPTLRFGF